MKGNATTLIIFIIVLLVGVLYLFFGRAQISKLNREMLHQIEDKQAKLDELRRKEEAIPRLKNNLATWRRQLTLFGEAIPAQIEDENFLRGLIIELDKNDVILLGLETVKRGVWLGEIDDKMREKLEGMKIDPDLAGKIKTADVTISLHGEFSNILNVFEGLKRHNRLYAIQLVTGPAAGGAGTITQTVDPNMTPIAITGRLYYGLPESEVDQADLERLYLDVVASPAAREVFKAIQDESRKLTGGSGSTSEPPADSTAASGTGDLALAKKGLALLPVGAEEYLR